MKRIFLVLLVILGLQTKAQINICDSIEYSIQPTGNTLLILNGVTNISGSIISWDWQACDNNMCYASSGQTGHFQQFTVTDTIKVCLTTTLDINGMIWTCNQCDSLVWDGFGGWMLLHNTNPVSLQEIKNIKQDYKMYDLLGKEFKNYNSIPKGTLYIKNREKFIK